MPGTSETHRGVVKDRKSSASNAAYIAASRAPMAVGKVCGLGDERREGQI